MDHPVPLDLSHAPLDIVTMVLQTLCLKDRFTCALVCTAWAEAATAATRSIIKHRVPDLRCLEKWLEKYGENIEVLQLNECYRLCLTTLPCAELQDLLLHGDGQDRIQIYNDVWDDIAAATKLTSVSLSDFSPELQQAIVVSALTALPDLQQLTWRPVHYEYDVLPDYLRLTDSALLQQLTKLTALELHGLTAAALQHLGSLTKLQRLSITDAEGWYAAGCPGLQELKALSSLCLDDIPTCRIELTALQQLHVSKATPTALKKLQTLTSLTQLRVLDLTGLSHQSFQLQLPGLQHLELYGCYLPTHMSLLAVAASCTQLRVLEAEGFDLRGPGTLAVSTTLQHLDLSRCSISAADEAADPISWHQVLPGPNQLPHLTSLQLSTLLPALQQSDIECVVACCSSLQVLHLDTLQDSFTPALARLPGLTSLHLRSINDQLCSSLTQLTGLGS